MFRSWKVIPAALAAAVVVGGGVGIGVMQLRAGDANEPGPPNIDTRSWVTSKGEQGWIVRHPMPWAYRPYRDHLYNRIDNAGATISNRPFDFRGATGATSFAGAFPADLAAVHIVHTEGGPSRLTTVADTGFPIVLEDAVRQPGGGRGGVLVRHPLVVDGRDGWSIDAWIGDRVSRRDAEIVRRIFSSFGFSSQTAGVLTVEERMIAHEIAESYRGARTALKGRPHTHPDFASDRTGDPACSSHRCGLVVFQITGGLRFRVLVDLEERRALKFG